MKLFGGHEEGTAGQRVFFGLLGFGIILLVWILLTSGTDPAAAMDYYRRVLAVDPNHPVANFNLGVLMVHAGDPSGEDLIRRGIALQPNLASAVPPDIPLG